MSGELSIQKFILVEKRNLSAEERKRLVDPIDNEVTAVDMDQVEDFQKKSECKQHNTPGYFVFSTAPFNIEDGEAKLIVDLTPAMQSIVNPNEIDYESVRGRRNLKIPVRKLASDQYSKSDQSSKNHEKALKEAISSIANDLKQAANHGTPELVIAVHGYSTEQTNVQRWYKKIFQYVNQEMPLKDKKNLVFVGYRWSSEQFGLFSLESIWIALQALPLLPKIILVGVGLIAFLCFIWANVTVWDLLPTLFLALMTAIASIVVSLVILRVIVYFRDNYRANNFAVPDLVELIRLLDVEMEERGFKNDINLKNGINLNFIGHSMGGFVVTNVIRILSDVFDQKAVKKKPSSKIGHFFCLKRLVLASPDIPVLTILTSRANFLASSVRRFDEAYLFSNEGDLALRLASTAANYFSFPARTRESGYRLGNVTVTPGGKYGVVNSSNLKEYCPHNSEIQFEFITPALNHLFVSNINDAPVSISKLLENRHLNSNIDNSNVDSSSVNQFTIADLFTYFDCTDYIEIAEDDDSAFRRFIEENKRYEKFIKKFAVLGLKPLAVGILSRAIGVRSCRQSRSLNVWNYTQLICDFRRGRDVHGGYFFAPFSQKLIYQLAFTGFRELMSSYDNNLDLSFSKFEQDCKKHWLQVLLSPLHYKSIYVQEEELKKIKGQMIEYLNSSKG
jgi:Alpha/beta hydrolase of unknown function (DUF900)